MMKNKNIKGITVDGQEIKISQYADNTTLFWTVRVSPSQLPYRYWTFSAKSLNREFKQIATAGATTAALTEKVWGEYVAAVCKILPKWDTKMSETWTKEFKISVI